jgi:hypothetical protein
MTRIYSGDAFHPFLTRADIGRVLTGQVITRRDIKPSSGPRGSNLPEPEFRVEEKASGSNDAPYSS